jgi:hypothetical protein
VLYSAHASFVKSPNCLDADIALGFDISIRKSLVIRDLPLSLFRTPEIRDKAKHCLIVLVGSKKVWARVGEYSQGLHMSDILIGGMKFSPVGYETVDNQLVVDVGKFMRWLLQTGLDHRKVIGSINGQVQTP